MFKVSIGGVAYKFRVESILTGDKIKVEGRHAKTVCDYFRRQTSDTISFLTRTQEAFIRNFGDRIVPIYSSSENFVFTIEAPNPVTSYIIFSSAGKDVKLAIDFIDDYARFDEEFDRLIAKKPVKKNGRKIEIEYTDENGQKVVRKISDIVDDGGKYFRAYCHLRKGVRTFYKERVRFL